jgi:hypothetical protein
MPSGQHELPISITRTAGGAPAAAEQSNIAASVVVMALHLASQMSYMSWDILKVAARQTPAWQDTAFRGHMRDLHAFMGPLPLFRTVSMLATVGLLTKQQKQGMVALLGGAASHSSDGDSSTTSCLLIEEPLSLVEARQQSGITLQDLAVSLLWVSTKSTAGSEASGPSTQLSSVASTCCRPLVQSTCLGSTSC